jgi:hypothetical protein
VHTRIEELPHCHENITTSDVLAGTGRHFHDSTSQNTFEASHPKYDNEQRPPRAAFFLFVMISSKSFSCGDSPISLKTKNGSEKIRQIGGENKEKTKRFHLRI